jgi:putative Mg2+ transporter-C (MgtC) family protein
VPELHWVEILFRVSLAAALGGAIGLEREIRDREAGLRTHMLVAVGAALFTLISAYAWTDFEFSTPEGIVFDPTRIAAQIVTGIGFLGAGAIIRQGLSVRGLTTAATLWVVAAIGMAAGVGYYEAAVLTTALVLFSLWPLRIAAHRFTTRFFQTDEGRLAIEVPAGTATAALVLAVEEAGGRVRSLEFQQEDERKRVELRVRMQEGREAAALVDAVAAHDEVLAARWNP